jgi:hypothetical protein
LLGDETICFMNWLLATWETEFLIIESTGDQRPFSGLHRDLRPMNDKMSFFFFFGTIVLHPQFSFSCNVAAISWTFYPLLRIGCISWSFWSVEIVKHSLYHIACNVCMKNFNDI